MRAVQYRAFREPPAIVDAPEPALAPDGAIIRVEATGLCRSDWHGWLGHDADIVPPHIPGHEFAGSIAALGAEVGGDWRIGDRVTAPFVCACGVCATCLDGDDQICDAQEQPGFTYPGSFAELVAVPRAAVNLVRLPDGLDVVTAASLGCRFATAFRAVTMQGRLATGEWLAVFGCGGVGLSAVMIGASLGARVVAVDVSEAALRAARDVGAEVTVDGSAPDVAARVRAATGGGAHVTLDALGSRATASAALEALRKRGRHVQVGLLVGDEARPPLPMELVIARELEIRGSHGLSAKDYPAMLARIVDGTLDPRRLVGRTIPLEDAPDALVAMGRPASVAGITVIEP
jgi:alcohol dehydrogenase